MKNIGEAFSFPFNDRDWASKILIGGLFTLLSVLLIGIPVLFGYYIELVQRLRKNHPNPLPDWNEPGVKFIVGFKFLVTLFVYYLPVILIAIPLFLMMIVVSVQQSHLTNLFGETLFLSTIFLVIVPYSLFISFLTPIITIEYAENERISQGLNIGRVLTLLKSHWQDALVATLITIGVQLLSAIGIIFFIIGIVFTSFYASLVRFHLYGQIAQNVYPPEPIPIVHTL